MASSNSIESRTLSVADSAPRVLVVEDDLVSREYLRLALERCGFLASAADSVPPAQQLLQAEGFDRFDCVVTDFRMPIQTGLDLLVWLRRQSPDLAAIVLTAEGERKLVTESLRCGAVDFLEKPVDPKDLRDAVTKAVKLTAERRRAAQVQSAVKELGRAQHCMINAPKHLAVDVKLSFHPILEAGGDFFSHFPVAADRYLCLLTDVSGHDLKAAYVSAYFQGVVRGMLERSAPVSEVLGAFNRFLLEDWNRDATTNITEATNTTSVACCSVLLDLKAHRASVHVSGLPAPVLVNPDGRPQLLGEGGCYPLGWFEDYSVPEVEYTAPAGSTFLLWTDGLVDLAEREGVTPLSLGYALQSSSAAGLKLPELARATDDLLFARVHLPMSGGALTPFHPLVVELYAGSQSDEIDRITETWVRSLRLAVPECSEPKLHDLLLASREALLNALKHGCQGRRDAQAFFAISYNADRNEFRVWVEDPGAGHDFDVEVHAGSANGQLVDEHRGLMLMDYLASNLRTERRGASVVMDFTV